MAQGKRGTCVVCDLNPQTLADIRRRRMAGEGFHKIAQEVERSPSSHPLYGHFTVCEADPVDAPKRLVAMLADAGMDPSQIGAVEKVRLSAYQSLTKNAEGEAEIHDLSAASFVLSPSWDAGPQWPVVQPADPIKVVSRPLKRERPTDVKVAAILPDPQFGFRRDIDTGELYPFHDERALDLAIQIIRVAQPDRIVNLGDLMDFPGFSRFTQEPGFALTEQQSVNRAHEFLAEQRANAPDAEIDVLEGNHDWRIAKAIIDNAKAAFGLRQANTPDSWPVLSVPHLLRFGDLRVNYHAGYPANEVWLNENLRAIHGLKVRSSSSTAQAVVDDERVNTIFGHVHRVELMHRTRHTFHGPRTTWALTPGCLCRIDGAVPSTKGGIDLLGRPLQSWENWQTGMAVVTYSEDGGPAYPEPITFYGNRAVWRGQEFTTDVQVKHAHPKEAA